MKPSRASALYGASSPSYKCSSSTASTTALAGQHYIAKTRSIACALFCMQPNHCHRQACQTRQDEKGEIGEYLSKTQFTGTCHHVTCGQIHPGVLHGLQPQMPHIRSGNLALEMQFIEQQTQNGPCISTRPAVFGAGGRNRTRDPLITSQVLYQLSYTGEGLQYSVPPSNWQEAQCIFLLFFFVLFFILLFLLGLCDLYFLACDESAAVCLVKTLALCTLTTPPSPLRSFTAFRLA